MMREKEENTGKKDEQIKGEGCTFPCILPLSPPTDSYTNCLMIYGTGQETLQTELQQFRIKLPYYVKLIYLNCRVKHEVRCFQFCHKCNSSSSEMNV